MFPQMQGSNSGLGMAGGQPPPPASLSGMQQQFPTIDPAQIAQMLQGQADPLGLAQQARPAQDAMGTNALLQALQNMGLDPNAEMGGLPNMPQTQPGGGMLAAMGLGGMPMGNAPMQGGGGFPPPGAGGY